MTGETSWERPRKQRVIKPRTILEDRDRTYNDPDPGKPRISEHFANQILDDVEAFTPEDHITFRQIFKSMNDLELNKTREALNKLLQHISDIKRIRKIRNTKELAESSAVDVNETEGG